MLQISDLKFSVGWLAKFKSRYNIHAIKLHGEAASIDQQELDKARKELQTLTSQYKHCDIFNADELAMFYKMLPNVTLAEKSDEVERGQKQNKERITVMVCCNATGTDKIRLLIINKFKNPHCFSSVRFDRSKYSLSLLLQQEGLDDSTHLW